MKSGPFSMRLLLEKAGFRLRGKSRADCIHCDGRSRGTVSFTDEVAFCHRCKWKANVVTLARELGLLTGDSPALRAIREEMRQRSVLDSMMARFETWRENRIREISARYGSLSASAVRAEEVLRKFPNDEAAWDALARFYHVKAQLSSAFDWLMFTKASDWLEQDSTPTEVFEAWRERVA